LASPAVIAHPCSASTIEHWEARLVAEQFGRLFQHLDEPRVQRLKLDGCGADPVTATRVRMTAVFRTISIRPRSSTASGFIGVTAASGATTTGANCEASAEGASDRL